MKTLILLGMMVVGAGAIGCASDGTSQAKRVWVMADTDSRIFVVKEPNGRISVLRFCNLAGLWKGMHADIVVRWHADADYQCYFLDSVVELPKVAKP